MSSPDISSIQKLVKLRIRDIAVTTAFDDLHEYSQFVETALHHRWAEHQTTAITKDIFYPDRVTDEDIDRFQDERRQFEESFPRAQRVALLSLTHSTFETELVKIARTVATAKAISLPDDVKTGWSSKSFLERECSINCDDKGWATFKAYQTVRNAFVHNDGRIDVPLRDGSDVTSAAMHVGAEISDNQMSLSRECTGNFVLLCRRLCKLILERTRESAL